LVLYLAVPGQTKVLVLGLDYTPPGSDVGRSDTIILTTFDPIAPRVSLLSVPRDLWVSIPGVGENRINTAHFFGEAQQTGYGPDAAIQTIQHNFGVKMDYYVRIHFEGFKEVVNALGGVDIDLPEPMAGYPAGRHHLTGNKALAFARSRMGSDDFFRMEQGQLLVKAILQQMFSLKKLPRLPGVLTAVSRAIDTNLPTWQLPRLGFALLRTGVDGIDNRTISREMVTPYITDQGANILLPDWGKINPLVAELLGD
jgi:LCP family protein required for cell wall assembly